MSHLLQFNSSSFSSLFSICIFLPASGTLLGTFVAKCCQVESLKKKSASVAVAGEMFKGALHQCVTLGRDQWWKEDSEPLHKCGDLHVIHHFMQPKHFQNNCNTHRFSFHILYSVWVCIRLCLRSIFADIVFNLSLICN